MCATFSCISTKDAFVNKSNITFYYSQAHKPLDLRALPRLRVGWRLAGGDDRGYGASGVRDHAADAVGCVGGGGVHAGRRPGGLPGSAPQSGWAPVSPSHQYFIARGYWIWVSVFLLIAVVKAPEKHSCQIKRNIKRARQYDVFNRHSYSRRHSYSCRHSFSVAGCILFITFTHLSAIITSG